MFCPWGFIYCSIFAPHLNLFTWWSHVSSSKELPTVGKCHKFTTMFSPAVFWHGNTDWILVNLCPSTPTPCPTKRLPVLLQRKNRWLFVTKAAACCSFVLFPQCKSAKAAVGFILMERDAFLCSNRVLLLLLFFLFACPCCSSSLPVCIRAALTAFCLHLELAINHVCLPSSVWTLFFPFSFQLRRLCSVWFLQGAY